jgi:hypothetical protein
MKKGLSEYDHWREQTHSMFAFGISIRERPAFSSFQHSAMETSSDNPFDATDLP